jgi:hypothetical protein
VVNGKEVRLAIEGKGTDLDKTIVEQIGDPLIHVIRNWVDEGLEPPEERLAAGKKVCGELKPRGVMIEVSDDGRGLGILLETRWASRSYRWPLSKWGLRTSRDWQRLRERRDAQA